MFKSALQASTKLTVKRIKSSATAAYKYFYILIMLSIEETDHTTSRGTTLLFYDICAWVLFIPIESRETGHTFFTSLSEKTRRSNQWQILKQRQNLLLNYSKTLSDRPAENWILASHTVSDEYRIQKVASQRICKDQPATKCMEHE